MHHTHTTILHKPNTRKGNMQKYKGHLDSNHTLANMDELYPF